MKLTSFVSDLFPAVSTATALTTFVRGAGVILAVQSIQPLGVVASIHSAPFSWYWTLATLPLSLAMPWTVTGRKLFVTRWPGIGAVMLTVGRCESRKLTCRVRFDCMVKSMVGLALVMPPTQLVETTQFPNSYPLAGVAVMEKLRPITSATLL